jgi:hypothetical protein
MNKYIAWFSGAANRYAVEAASRKDAIAKFAALHGVVASSYIHCRKPKKEGEYCLLTSGNYGMLHG